jgi:hypothetical protein
MDRSEHTTSDSDELESSTRTVRRQRRGSAIGFVSGVALMVVLAVVTFTVFAQLAERRGTASDAGQGTWTTVLSDYSVSEVVSAPSQSDVMYACASKWGGGTSAVTSSSGTYANPPFSVLRSTDGGAAWAATLTTAQLSGNCQIAVSPSNSDDIYVESDPRIVPTGALVAPYLLHSTDGGRTSTRIDPIVLAAPDNSSAIAWSVEDLTQVGNRLYGLATVPEVRQPPLPRATPEPQYAFSLERLVMSSDGGHTWEILDSAFQAAELDARSFAVDPANPLTIFILVGQPVGPVIYQVPHRTEPAFPPQPSNVSGDLYKTTSGGRQWTRILAGLPYGASVRVSGASAADPLVYVGGSPSPIPLAVSNAAPPAGNGTATSADLTSGSGEFSLWTSADGGSSWRQASVPPRQVYVDQWLVGPDGDVYIYQGGYFTENSSGNAVGGSSGSGPGSGDGAPGTPAGIPPVGSSPPGTPVSSIPPTSSGGAGIPVTGTVQFGPTPTATDTATGTNICYRYDPATREWSSVAMPARQGYLLAVSPGSSGQTVLWFMSEDNEAASLYRNVAS